MKSSIIPKGELLSYGICEYGTEDDQDRHVARNDLLVEELVPNEGMSFGAAIALMKKGKKVCRKGWNGKGMWLWLKPATQIKAEWCKDEMLKGLAEENGGEILGLGTVCMYTHDSTGRKAILTGWLSSQSDMLCEDWMVVE